jgi:hypothetical protein
MTMQFKKLALGVVVASVGAFGLSSAAFAGDPIAVGVSAGINAAGSVTDLNAATAVGPNAAANATITGTGANKTYSANAAASEQNLILLQSAGTTTITGTETGESSLANDYATPEATINSVFGTP